MCLEQYYMLRSTYMVKSYQCGRGVLPVLASSSMFEQLLSGLAGCSMAINITLGI